MVHTSPVNGADAENKYGTEWHLEPVFDVDVELCEFLVVQVSVIVFVVLLHETNRLLWSERQLLKQQVSLLRSELQLLKQQVSLLRSERQLLKQQQVSLLRSERQLLKQQQVSLLWSELQLLK